MLWSSYTSATVQSTAKNFIMKSDSAFTHTYRAYIKTTECGELKLKFWCSNLVDSTWADGSESRAILPGGLWKIESAYIADGGRLPDGSVAEGTLIPVTFDSSSTRTVMPGETFWSDAVRITLPKEHYLVFSWTITTMAAGVSFPTIRKVRWCPPSMRPGMQLASLQLMVSANPKDVCFCRIS